jgi:hypothetical protein
MPNPTPTQAEYLTDLPTVTAANPTDIIYAVQGFSSNNPGLSVQETLGQVLALAQTTFTLHYSGNPNGNIAGTIFQYCWDTVDGILYICTFAGTATTAVWSKVITLTGGSGVTIVQNGNVIEISASSAGITWNDVTGTSVNMMTNSAYQPNNAGLVTLALPTASSFGDELWIKGLGAGGWTITQAAGQQMIVGPRSTTVGVGGSLSSTDRHDAIQFVCITPNLVWQDVSGPQGCLNII